MKQTLLIILPVLAIALLLSACSLKPTTPSANTNATNTAGEVSGTKDAGQAISGSITDLIKLGKNFRCEIVAKEGQQIVSGVSYVANNNLRSDYKMKIGTQEYNSHSITTPEWMYSWIDELADQATKIKIADMEKYNQEAQATDQTAANYDAQLDYKCFTWTPDQTKFVPPTNINFKDMTALLQQAPTGDTKVSCAGCDLIEDAEGKAACQKALKCQ